MAVIRQQTQVFNKPVGVVRSSSGSQSLAQSISRAADTVTDITFQKAAKEAQSKGIEAARAVEAKRLRTFNPETGKPEAYKAPEGFGTIAAQAYQSVIDKRFEDSITQELRIKAQEIALKYQYNPTGYADVMSDYIASMSENAGGQYSQFIEETGQNFLASTRLNIQERVAARARQNLAESVVAGLDQASDEAYNIAAAGGFVSDDMGVNEAGALLDREVGNVSNAVASGLVKAKSDVKARLQLQESVARGGVEYILSKTKTSADRNAVALALRTRGAQIDSVPQELRDDVKALIPYLENADVANRTISHSNSVSSEYDAVERDQIAIRKAEAERTARQQLLGFEDTIDNVSLASSYQAYSAFSEIDESGQYLPFAVTAAVSTAGKAYNTINGTLRSQFVNGQITEADYNARDKDARQSILRSFLIEGAAQGNPEEFRIAVVSNNPADLSRLTPSQRELIASVHETGLFDPNEDAGFAREVVAANINEARSSRDKERAKAQLFDEASILGQAAESGAVDDAAYQAFVQKINSNVGDVLTAVQRQDILNTVVRQRAIGDVVTNASNMTSEQLNKLSLFVETRGHNRSNMTPDQIALGERIVNSTRPEDVDAITGKINGMRVLAKQKEDALDRQQTRQQNIDRLLSGGGNVDSAADRNLAQELIEAAGINLRDPASNTPEVFSLIRSIPPASLVSDLQTIANGLPLEGADTLLDHFVRVSNDISPNGVMVNRFGESLSKADVELLNDINQIRITVGGDVNDIAATLIARRNDPKSKIQMDITLREKTPTEYVTDYTNGWFSSPDPFIANELAPAVEYLARTGKSKEQIDARLKVLIDQSYPEVEYIADPRRPLGSLKRSRYALEATIPDQDDRNEFLRTIESQLPTGYSIFAKTYDANQALAMSQGMDAGEPAGQKQVYLVPDETTAGVTYFTYFVDENNELRPLIYDDNGTMVHPAFDLDEIADYRAKKAADNKAKLLDQARSREQYYEQLRGTARDATVPMAVSPF